MSEEEVFAKFLESFGDQDGDGLISKEEWYNYYCGISASVDSDEEFVLIITNAWKLD